MATEYIGSWFATILELVVILDAMALALAICVTIGRGFFALGRDGLLPSVFTRTSRHGTPWVGNLVVAVGRHRPDAALVARGLRLAPVPRARRLGQPRPDPPRRVRDVHPVGDDRLARGRARLPDPRGRGVRARAAGGQQVVAVRRSWRSPSRRRSSATSVRSSPEPHDRLERELGGALLDDRGRRGRARVVRRPDDHAAQERRQRRGARGRAPRRAAARRDARLPVQPS